MIPLLPGGVREQQAKDSHPNTRTLAPGEYGRITGPDGAEKWWVRTSRGTWALLTHHQVTKHEDGTITVSSSR